MAWMLATAGGFGAPEFLPDGHPHALSAETGHRILMVVLVAVLAAWVRDRARSGPDRG
jgi:hypothetical protein